MYEEDKSEVVKVLGVHFPQNDNSLHKDTIGIEIKISKNSKNLTMIESLDTQRYRVLDFDSKTNFCQAIAFDDVDPAETFKSNTKEGIEINQKDLLKSEKLELRNLWF